jgi:hypothetical protein
MKRMLFVVAMLVFAQGYVLASDVTTFKDGSTEGMADLVSPAYSDVIDISLPVECRIMKATMDVMSVPLDGNNPTSPENVSVYLNDTLLWRFDGPDYGSFGMQDSFVNDTDTMSNQFGPSGGQISTKIRLPKRVNVQNTSFDVDCNATWRGLLLELNLTGTGDFGNPISGAGDVNNDSYDDLIIGAFSFNSSRGAAFIFLGGPSMDSVPDLVLNGVSSGDYFGYSVSGAGDLNGDGFDDVIVGAPYNVYNGNMTGSAYVFYGGATMDSTPDVILYGEFDDDEFGVSVAGAGDVNKDGFDDVIVGADTNDNNDPDAGAAYIYFGGANMDNSADVGIWGDSSYQDYFGSKVSSAGDVNKDGFDDVMVGAPSNDRGTTDAGCVYIYFGGATMDSTPDVIIAGTFTNEQLGTALASAGDVNNDGYGDVIIGSQYNSSGGFYAGAAYIYYGGASIDATADVSLVGTAPNDYFGFSVSGAVDLNNDGYDDVLVGAFCNDSAGTDAGSVNIFFGGAPMNNVSDIQLNGAAAQNYYGWSVAGTGDLNGDGFPGVLVGTATNKAYLYETAFGVKEPQVSVGQTLVWARPWYFNSTAQSGNFANMLNSYISSNYASGADVYGNTYIDVPIRMSCKSNGLMTIDQLRIAYVSSQIVPEFTDLLATYISEHASEKDANGNITIPFKITSVTPGKATLSNLLVQLDDAPKLLGPIPDFEMDEDTMQSDQINIREYFNDDNDGIDKIVFALVSHTNESIVAVALLENGFISLDAATGPQNDNWTGVVEIQVNASDRWESTTYSNVFKVIIKDIPDAPKITSQPPMNAVPGQEYVYNLTAVDGDNETLTYNLANGPANMTLNSTTGNIVWVPLSAGKYDISLSVSDGTFTVYQNYTLNIPNRVPRITNLTIPNALVDTPYVYDIPAVDDDQDVLRFSFVTPVLGMSLDPVTGRISWTPTQAGEFPVSVAISDNKDTTVFDFNITVKQSNRVPKFTSIALTTATVDILYVYNAMATDDDKDVLTYTLESGPTGMTVDNATGRVSWTPSDTGNVTVAIKVSDGNGGEARQEFSIKVSEPVSPKVTVLDPSFSIKWNGKVTVSGSVKKGTRDVTVVQYKIDAGAWKTASGNSSWSFVLDTKPLKDGKHTLSIRAYDGKIYSDVTTNTFTVSNPAPKGPDYTLPIIVVIVLVAAVAAGAGAAMSRKKRAAEEEHRVEEEPPINKASSRKTPPTVVKAAKKDEETPEEDEDDEKDEKEDEEAEDEEEEEEAEDKEQKAEKKK